MVNCFVSQQLVSTQKLSIFKIRAAFIYIRHNAVPPNPDFVNIFMISHASSIVIVDVFKQKSIHFLPHLILKKR